MAWCKRDVSDFFRWNFFLSKSAWIFACAFQLSSTTFPCIFFPSLHFVSEKNKDKIFKRAQLWPQQNRTRAFQPEKQCRIMFFYLIKKHMQKFRHFWRKKNFTWKSHLHPSCTKPFNKPSRPLRPGLKALWGLASKALKPWYERPRARTSPRFFAKIEHGQNSSKLRMPICLYV